MVDETQRRRGQSAAKHEAILEAATSLFLSDGYDRTSVDAIAARAAVSKRTVYDHFGDKASVLEAVLRRSTETLVATVRGAIDDELRPGRDLEVALLAFARRITTEAFSSSDHVVFRRFENTVEGGDPALGRPEAALEERLNEYARSGELDVPDASRAAQHFVALTLQLALVHLDHANDDDGEVDRILIDGVAVFVRAYRAQAS
ncbi:TetR/AcrR family transcriptional regulator [Demequina aestuarii]|uniref:TetR/AcrR family transcriptional regulator n=1 Tax=Demequina aestuarii TaxID=327095 RepID=UPI000784BB14|nr:TetR/AcrR family transcriptional regulator [Demequina aestuarii]